MVDAAAAHDLEILGVFDFFRLGSLSVLAKLTPSNGPCVKPVYDARRRNADNVVNRGHDIVPHAEIAREALDRA